MSSDALITDPRSNQSRGGQEGQSNPYMVKSARIFVAGHRGLVGSAILRHLTGAGYANIQTRERRELDLTDQQAVRRFFESERPEFVFLAAARVGGILANATYPAEFIRENLAIQTNVIHEAWRGSVQRLLFLGSSCIYPRDCPQPIKEDYLLSGPLEPTNRPYAVAKIAGVELCWAYYRQYGARFLAMMPTNLYGPGDHFDLQTSHVLPALMRKFHEARNKNESTEAGTSPTGNKVVVWGTGTPRREFLHVDDMADACGFLMNLPSERFDALLGNPPDASPPLVNVGCGKDISIEALAELMRETVGYNGEVEWDLTKPDGTPQKLLDVSRLRELGWHPRISLREGLRSTYRWYLDNPK